MARLHSVLLLPVLLVIYQLCVAEADLCSDVKEAIKNAANTSNPFHWQPTCGTKRTHQRKQFFTGLRLPKHTRTLPLRPPSNRIIPLKPGENARPTESVKLPENYDASEIYGTKCPSFKHIFDQSGCNNCWAISTTSMATHRRCMHTNEHGANQTIYSVRQMSSCNNKDACDFIHSLDPPFEYWENSGLPTESCQPLPNYMGDLTGTKCPIDCNDGEGFNKTVKSFGSKRYQINYGNNDEIKKEIYLYGPIVAGIFVYGDLSLYKGRGVYRSPKLPGTELGGHAIVVHGWGVEDGVNYWLIANSWGRDFGSNGFLKYEATNDAWMPWSLYAAVPVEGLSK